MADPGYPPDGMNLLPALTGNVAAVDRKLFWRYKGKWQRAARIGDYTACCAVQAKLRQD